MAAQNPYQKYQNVQVQTADQGKLIIMLYQGCIKFLKLAKKSIEEKDIEGANNNLTRAQAIVNELKVTLDKEKGGQIAENLDNLYEFMSYQLIQANIKKDTTQIEVVEELMIELLDAWKQIINKQSKKNNQKEAVSIQG